MIVGIDLGTSNSAIGVWRDGKAELIPNSLGSLLTPSAVSVDDDGRLLVGLAARERQVTHPHLAVTAFKRWMGSKRVTKLGQAPPLLPEELSALVLRSLKADAEAFLGEPVTEAIVTVPAYFNDRQRKATRRAGQLAGLRVDRLLNEPTAAALAYSIHEVGGEARFLVFDLGGGTFDVSVVELFEGVVEVRASTGDNQLGGEDFNQLLINDFLNVHHQLLERLSATEQQGLLERIREQAERARRRLTDQSVATLDVTWRDRRFTHEIEAERFERLAEPLLARLRDPVVQALRDAGIASQSLDAIILVGGATRMPLVRRCVSKMFGRFPDPGPHPDEAIAVGAAIQAGLKSRDAALREVVMTDVCPYSLGVDIAQRRPDGSMQQGIFSPIIERNTVVPTSRVQTYSTLKDGQRSVLFTVYQGESRRVADNIELGRVELPVPPRPAGEVPIEVRFSYDIDGLLEIDVSVPTTGEARQLVLFDSETEHPAGDVDARRRALAALKVHPREHDVHRAALARGERCFEQMLGESRQQVGLFLEQYEAALDSQDLRRAERARLEFLQLLDTLEGQTYL